MSIICDIVEVTVSRTLAVALPAEPSEEVIEAMARAIFGDDPQWDRMSAVPGALEDARAAYRALRNHLGLTP